MSVALTVRQRAKEDEGAFKAFLLPPPLCLMEPEPPYYHEAKEGEIALFSLFFLPWLSPMASFFGFF